MSREIAQEDPPFVAFGIVGAGAGAVLGWLGGRAGGEPGDQSSDWQPLGLLLMPILLAAVCYNLERGSGVMRSVVLAPVVAVSQVFLAIAWVAGYFLVVLPAIGVYALLYGPLGWDEGKALAVGLVAVAGWTFLLSRLPVRPFVDAFYDIGVRVWGVLLGAICAAAPVLIVGLFLSYYLGWLDDPEWEGTQRDGLVGAIVGGIYGLSVGLLVPWTTMFAMLLGED